MPFVQRRLFIAGGLAFASTRVLAQGGHAHHGDAYERLQTPGRVGLPEIANQQRVYDSPAPKAASEGRWITRAALPLPRSEMAWATTYENRLHLVGGYGEQRVDRPYHQVYDQASDRWLDMAPLPKGANHVGVAVANGKLFAVGGHQDQNRRPHAECFIYDGPQNSWTPIAPLPRPFGATGLVAVEDMIHAVGGAIGDTNDTKESVNWHYAYDSRANRWVERAPLPTGRDHTGTLAARGKIHVIGGRVDNFYTNSNLHHVYDPQSDKWTARAPFPTARSGHGAVLYRDKIFCMGGEGSNRVFAQNEAYDIDKDSWELYAPMPTPRHGLGAAVIGDFVHVAGGGPIMGGGVQSAVHEAFTLG